VIDLHGATGRSLRNLSQVGKVSWEWQTTVMSSEKAYFATGCFWGAERRFWQLPGVLDTSVGYMGGDAPSPTYELVCKGTTGHAEIVEVIFDSTKVSYQELLREFWTMHDPTTLNRQGNDIGSQYRSVIFTTTQEQLSIAQESASIYQGALTAVGCGPITTNIRPAEGMTYWLAEEYHQKYLKKNPLGYDCHSSTGVPYPIEVPA